MGKYRILDENLWGLKGFGYKRGLLFDISYDFYTLEIKGDIRIQAHPYS